MARVVSAMPRGGRKHRSYPWDQWFDGRVWKLIPGEDFDCAYSSLRSLAHMAANSRGLGVRTAWSEGALHVQAVAPSAVDERAAYPWDAWLDGNEWKLIPGLHFTVATNTLRALGHYHANRRGLAFKSRSRDGAMYIRAVTRAR